MYQFEFFPQMIADQSADFAEKISVYLRIKSVLSAGKGFNFKNDTPVPNCIKKKRSPELINFIE